ncbi:unnamed protein product [Heterobilharzia americana]|nr:unnamed protein product [Heterobilharzia americana]
MHNLHANEEEGVTSVPGTNGQPLDLSLYDKLNKAKIKVKRGRLRRLHKSRSQIYPHKYNLCMKNNQQNSNRAPCLAVKSEILICPICHMEATNFSIFAQHMSLHFSQLPMNSSDYFNYNYDSYKYLQENVGTRCNVDMETRNSTVDNEHLTPENTRLLELIMLKDYCSAEDIVTKGDEENCGVKTSTSNVNILSCNICSNLTTFGQFADLMNHLQNKHLLTYYYCNGCGEKFTDRIQCLVHILCRHVSPTKPVDGGSDNTFHASDSSTTVTNNTDVNSAVLSSNANENNSLKCHSVNGIWNTEPRLHNIRSMNTVIKEKNSVQNLNKFIKNKISSSLNEYSSNHHSTTNEQCDLSNLNKQVDNGLNREGLIIKTIMKI